MFLVDDEASISKINKRIEELGISMAELHSLTNEANDITPFHLLAKFHETLTAWVESGKISIDDLKEIKNNNGNTVFHWLAQHNSELLHG